MAYPSTRRPLASDERLTNHKGARLFSQRRFVDATHLRKLADSHGRKARNCGICPASRFHTNLGFPVLEFRFLHPEYEENTVFIRARCLSVHITNKFTFI
jgi:hypothetical protein